MILVIQIAGGIVLGFLICLVLGYFAMDWANDWARDQMRENGKVEAELAVDAVKELLEEDDGTDHRRD